jgi:hypothetical protein
MARNERKSRHKALLREVAALINQPVDSLAVRLTALARLKLDSLEAQLLAGDSSVTVADITTLQETFDKYVPKRTINVEIEIIRPSDVAPADSAAVSGLVECRRCHWTPADKDRVTRCYRCGCTLGQFMRDFDNAYR